MLGEQERRASAQSKEWDSSRRDGRVAGIGDRLEEGKKLEVAKDEDLIMPSFYFFAELTVGLTRSGEKHETQKSVDVMFDDSFDA